MFRHLTLLVLAAAAVSAQVPAQGTIVRSKSNITNNIVAEADGRLMCKSPAGKACSAEDVQELMAIINNSHSNIKNLALAAPDGTLRCQTADGKPCTVTHVPELNTAIRATYDLKQGKGARVSGNAGNK